MRPFYADVFDKWCWWCRIVTWLNFSDLSWARSRMKWGDKHFDFNPKNATKNIGLTNSSCLNGWLWSDHVKKLPTNTDNGLLQSRLSHMTWVRILSCSQLFCLFQIILSIKSSEIYKIRPLTETCTVTYYVNCKSGHLAVLLRAKQAQIVAERQKVHLNAWTVPCLKGASKKIRALELNNVSLK